MGIKVTVKRRIVFNGKTYDSPEELPENVRQAYAKALADPAAASSSTPKVVFNGTEYDGLDAMPPEVRALYESALGAVESGRRAQGMGTPAAAPPVAAVSGTPIEPGSANPSSLRAALVAALVLALLLLGYYFYTTAAK